MRVRGASQPHVHPAPGVLDKRGNCPGCAVYEPRFYVVYRGGGYAVVDSEHKEPMIGPYRSRRKAAERASEFNRHPDRVPPREEGGA